MNSHPLAETPSQLVTFRLQDEELAVPICLVQEIIRHPVITRVPSAPAFLDGIGNLRGRILPIVNLRARLGLEPKQKDEQTRVVVLRSTSGPIGVVVDGVSEVMSIDQKCLERPPMTVAGIDGQFLKFVAKIDDGKRLVLILDENKMLPDTDWENQKMNHELSENKGSEQNLKSDGMTRHDSEQLVTFSIDQEEYAIDIMQVKEIIRVTEITPVPRAPQYILGVMSLRNHLLPIMNLRARFGLSSENNKAGGPGGNTKVSQRIVVIDVNGNLTGIQVDSVSQVLTVEKSKIENPPAILKATGGDCLRGVGKLDGGKRILMLIEISKLITEVDQEGLSSASARVAAEILDKKQDSVSDEVQLVCFKVDHEEYALDIMKVQEIIRLKEVTSIPRASKYVEGIINLRSSVVPIVNMRTRLGLGKAERNNHNRIVIVNIGGKVTGLIVDSVSEVIRLQRSQIDAAPETVTDTKDKYIEGVGKLNQGKRILLLLKADAVLAEHGTAAA